MRGSIRKRSAGSWLLQIELERTDGKRHRRFVTVQGSRKDAQRELAKLLTAAADGILPDPTRATVGEAVMAYLDSATDISPKTKERYRELAAKQIIPHIGGVKLSKLRPDHLDPWHKALLEGGLSVRTVGHAHHVLGKVLRRAVENGTLSRNVAHIRTPPKVEEREVEILTPDQVSAVLEALKGHSLYPVVALALASGMRRGELCALQWSDIDLDRGVIRVERSLEETKSGLRVKAPKTKTGRRNITLSAEAVSMLKEHRKGQIELRLALGQGGQPTLVFSGIEGDHIKPNSISRNLLRLVTLKGLPRVGFHSLRHAHASALLRAGVDILTISRRLGHRKASITLDTYGHLIEGADAAAAKAIEGVLK